MLFLFHHLLSSILSGNDCRKLSALVPLCFRAVQSTSASSSVLKKKYLPGLGSFLRALK